MDRQIAGAGRRLVTRFGSHPPGFHPGQAGVTALGVPLGLDGVAGAQALVHYFQNETLVFRSG